MPKATPREKELGEQLARATAENTRLSGGHSRVMQDNERMRAEIRLLHEKIDALVRRVFGAQSESSGAR